MPMSPRLLRPRQTIHPEAANWANRVRTNGGSVSGTTLSAVDRFVKAIDAAGIRDRFYRLNLFCGNSDASLAAVRTPLYRGPSLGGTQFGGTTDTNVNFVAGDYAETGASGGLVGNGSTKYLDTGLPVSSVPFGNLHMAAYARTQATGQYAALVGSYTHGGDDGSLIQTQAGVTTAGAFAEENNATGFASFGVANPTGFLMGSSVSSTDRRCYLNGAQSGATVTSALTRLNYNSRTAWVFSRNTPNLPFATTARLAGYSIGVGMTAAQAASYYSAMQTFQTALGRQV